MDLPYSTNHMDSTDIALLFFYFGEFPIAEFGVLGYDEKWYASKSNRLHSAITLIGLIHLLL